MKTANLLPALLALALGPACTIHDPSEPGLLVARTVDEDVMLGALDVNGTRLHADVRGPEGAPVIVLLHGGPGGDFRYMLPMGDPTLPGALSLDHRLVFFDQRGTGLSRRHDPSEVTMNAYQADLEQLVDQVSPGKPVILVGHSWGGAYAAWYAGHHPDRTRGAVLIDPEAITHALYVAHGSPLDPDYLSEWLNDPLWARETLSADDHARADFLLASLESYDIPRFGSHAPTPLFRPGAVVFKYLDYRWFSENDYDFSSGLSSFPRPVWILAGTADHVLGYEFQQAQVPLFADARLVALDGDGHNDPVMQSAPRTVALVRAYLDSLAALP